MNKKNPKISYDKAGQVLSIEIRRGKSVDSEIHGNVVIDYDRQGEIVRINFYNFSFADFRLNAQTLKNFVRQTVSSSIR